MASDVKKNDPGLVRWLIENEETIAAGEMKIEDAIRRYKEKTGREASRYAVGEAAKLVGVKFPMGPRKGYSANPTVNYLKSLEKRIAFLEEQLGISRSDTD